MVLGHGPVTRGKRKQGPYVTLATTNLSGRNTDKNVESDVSEHGQDNRTARAEGEATFPRHAKMRWPAAAASAFGPAPERPDAEMQAVEYVRSFYHQGKRQSRRKLWAKSTHTHTQS